jgi:RNA polymerase sigma factor (sigma-70 family)
MNTDLEKRLKAKYISADEIISAIREYNQETNEQKKDGLREIIVNNNLRLVAKEAHKFARKSGSVDDYFQNGLLGLLVAIDKFDTDRGVKFSTYAMFWIKKYMQDEQTTELSIDVPKSAGKSKLFPGSFTDLDNTVGDTSLTFNEIIKDQRAVNPEEKALQDKAKSRLLFAIDNLPTKQGQVIMLRYFNGDELTTLENVGKEMGLTKERVRQIEKSATETLRETLEGIDLF